MKRSYCVLLIVLILCLLFSFTSCGLIQAKERRKLIDYYKNVDNFIQAAGTVVEILDQEEDCLLVLTFGEDVKSSVSSPQVFASRRLLIEGENYTAVKSKGFDEKIKVGSFLEFTTVVKALTQKARPIVSLTVDGETLLDFEEGYQGLMKQFE